MKDNYFIKYFKEKSPHYEIDGPFISIEFANDEIQATTNTQSNLLVARYLRRAGMWHSETLGGSFTRIEIVSE